LRRVITLTTDFGLRDPYVGVMKGVILSINPEAIVVDISHDVPRHDVKAAALTLWSSYKYFPEGSIHVVVVDPGVGTSRRAIAIRSRRHFFVGPDNGALMMAAADDGLIEVREVVNPKFKLSRISQTFHGRDVFAPTAARLSLGEDFSDLGPIIDDPIKLELPKFTVEGGRLVGEVLYVDGFGNVVTSIPSRVLEDQWFGKEFEVKVGEESLKARLVKAYAEVDEGEPLLIPDSFDLVELAVNKGNAAERFKVRVGLRVEVRLGG